MLSVHSDFWDIKQNNFSRIGFWHGRSSYWEPTRRYKEIDRGGKFWTEEAPRKAAKHGLSVGAAFAGLLLFDLLGLQAARACFGPAPFRRVAEFAQRLPFATFEGKHAAATRSSQGAKFRSSSALNSTCPRSAVNRNLSSSLRP